MPEDSIKIYAIWNAIISFNENGGTDVEDISTTKNETITLPTGAVSVG